MTENLLLLPPKEGGPLALKVFTRPGVTGVGMLGRAEVPVAEAGDIASADAGEATVAGGERASSLALSAAFICKKKQWSAVSNNLQIDGGVTS